VEVRPSRYKTSSHGIFKNINPVFPECCFRARMYIPHDSICHWITSCIKRNKLYFYVHLISYIMLFPRLHLQDQYGIMVVLSSNSCKIVNKIPWTPAGSLTPSRQYWICKLNWYARNARNVIYLFTAVICDTRNYSMLAFVITDLVVYTVSFYYSLNLVKMFSHLHY